ncbi:MAG: hypothetical protein Q8R28_21735, partial [Dehalococcoidia bacterium]|nr:hypothetical protein [Dehalococcoidia bacterium]
MADKFEVGDPVVYRTEEGVLRGRVESIVHDAVDGDGAFVVRHDGGKDFRGLELLERDLSQEKRRSPKMAQTAPVVAPAAPNQANGLHQPAPETTTIPREATVVEPQAGGIVQGLEEPPQEAELPAKATRPCKHCGLDVDVMGA